MASDLAAMPPTGLQVQASGDCHLLNFGLFATPERNVVFGLNDFDESLPGPWEWDLKRLVASFVVVGRELGFDDDTAMAVAAVGVRSRCSLVLRRSFTPVVDDDRARNHVVQRSVLTTDQDADKPESADKRQREHEAPQRRTTRSDLATVAIGHADPER